MVSAMFVKASAVIVHTLAEFSVGTMLDDLLLNSGCSYCFRITPKHHGNYSTLHAAPIFPSSRTSPFPCSLSFVHRCMPLPSFPRSHLASSSNIILPLILQAPVKPLIPNNQKYIKLALAVSIQKLLIDNGDMSFGQIARRVGYTNPGSYVIFYTRKQMLANGLIVKRRGPDGKYVRAPYNGKRCIVYGIHPSYFKVPTTAGAAAGNNA